PRIFYLSVSLLQIALLLDENSDYGPCVACTGPLETRGPVGCCRTYDLGPIEEERNENAQQYSRRSQRFHLGSLAADSATSHFRCVLDIGIRWIAVSPFWPRYVACFCETQGNRC